MPRALHVLLAAALLIGCASPASPPAASPAAPAAETAPAARSVPASPAAPVATSTAARDMAPAAAPAATPAATDPFIDDLLARMTLEEKLGQLTQFRGRWGDTGPRVEEGGEAEIRAGQVGSFLGVYGAEYTRELQRIAVEESRMGIPLLFAHDVIHGFRTTFPVPLAEASSWDPEAVERAARVAAVEGAAHGLHWTFAPMVDIARDPRWGRVVEGAGEDPYLGSVMAAARVRGFQGTGLEGPGSGGSLARDDTLLATAKHFVAYGAAEGGRDYAVADVSERTLWEVYLPPFRAAVDAGAGSVMAAFNEVAGVPMHAHRHLIEDVLRGAWGWDGVLVSDYTGVMELMPHGVAADPPAAGVLALAAGVDVDMVSKIYLDHLPRVVRDGGLDEVVVDRAVRRVLEAKRAVSLFDDPYRYADPEREAALTLTAEHRAAARAMARDSMVLLKNEGGVLPLPKDLGTVAVIGALADDPVAALGNWKAAGRPEDAVDVLAGIEAALPGAEVVYVRGAGPRDGFEVPTARNTHPPRGEEPDFAAAVAAAHRADAVILVVGEDPEMSAEANNRTRLDLPGAQPELVRRVHAAVEGSGKPLVVVLMNGRPLAVPWLDENVPAILETWFLGVETGPAVADVLFGDHNPSGKLPVTFPRSVGQVPIYHAHRNTGRPPDADNKYTSKYIDSPWTPLYPFGHGLSYTTFEYAAPGVSPAAIGPDGEVTVEVTVTNSGSRAGAEVVQLYLRDDVASVTRPVRELAGFEKVWLEPGESRRVSFRLGGERLELYDAAMRRVVEPGTFTVFVGGSSAATQQARFSVEAP